LNGSSPYNSGDIAPATYTVTQGTLPTGWEFVSAQCSDDQVPNSIVLQHQQTIFCAFKYVKLPKLNITVIEEGVSSCTDNVAATITGPSGFDPEQRTVVCNQSLQVTLETGSPFEIQLSDIPDTQVYSTCSGITLAGGDSKQCQIRIVHKATLVVRVQTIPAGLSTNFDFMLMVPLTLLPTRKPLSLVVTYLVNTLLFKLH